MISATDESATTLPGIWPLKRRVAPPAPRYTVPVATVYFSRPRSTPVEAPEPPGIILSPPTIHAFTHRAVNSIRAWRKVPQDGFPNDLGCETQLVLALAIRKIVPQISMRDLAEGCAAPAVDAIFFSTLCDLSANRLEGETAADRAHATLVEQAARILCGDRDFTIWRNTK